MVRRHTKMLDSYYFPGKETKRKGKKKGEQKEITQPTIYIHTNHASKVFGRRHNHQRVSTSLQYWERTSARRVESAGIEFSTKAWRLWRLPRKICHSHFKTKMKFTSCSSSAEFTFPSFEGLQCTKQNAVISKQIFKVKKNNVRVSNCHAKKLFISSHLMPGHLEGLYTGKKQLEDEGHKLEFVRTLLIDNYDSYTYNIYQELSIINGLPPFVVHNDDLEWNEVHYYLYEENAFDNIVISPGPGTPACPADIGICLRLLLECRDIPILGVCLGHQALGYVHGARVVHGIEPVHGRLSEIEHNGCRLFQSIPSGNNSGFKVVRYHSLVVDAESLPNELIPIAWTSSSDALSYLETPKSDIVLDAYESQIGQKSSDFFSSKLKNGTSCPSRHTDHIESRKILMGIKHSTRPHYGLQFHPESIGTCYGRQIFKNFREMTQDYWLKSKSSVLSERKAHHAGLPFGGIPRCKQIINDIDARNSFGKSSLLYLSLPSSGFKFLKLKWRKFDHLASDVGGARSIFCKLFGDHKAEDTFWLDSSSTEKRARFSFMGGKGGSLWKQVTFRLSHRRRGGNLSIEDGKGCIRSMFLEDGFLDFLNKELLSLRYDEKDYEGLPFDFHGGYVGYIGYNLKVECGMRSNHHKSSTPDACFFFADNLIVIDHDCDDVYMMSLHEGQTDTTQWLDDTEKKLLKLRASAANKFMVEHPQPVRHSPSEAGFIADKSREQYMKDVEKCLKLIKDGESYELCLTTQMRKRIGQVDYLGLYLNLREKNPAPYAAWLNFSKENLCICCSSPERFLQLDGNGILEAKPIKGTIARGSTKDEDEHFRLQLQYSEKDQAENLMIVDLLRNDLGRVCEPGSIHVPSLMDVESYSTVHTMVSTIRGKKQSKMSPVNCVKAAFPGGSMTGAPKLRSMELLDAIENSSRGIYSGSIGFFSYNQTFDLNIVIRTIVIHEGEASIGGGGAIVALSNPESEYEEMILKTRAPVSAVLEFQEKSLSN